MSTLQLPSELNETLMYHNDFYKLVGLDFFIDDSDDSIIKSKGKLIFSMSMFCVTITWQMWFVFTQNEFIEVAFGMTCGMTLIQDIITLLLIAMKKHKIKEVFEDIAEVWPDVNQEEQKKEIWKDWLRILHTFNRWFTRLVTICIIISVVLPFIVTVYGIIYGAPEETNYNYPINVYQPVEINSFFRYVVFYLFVATTSAAMHLGGFASYTLLMLTLTYNVSALLCLLHFDLENFIQPRAPNELGTERVAEEKEAMKTIIKTHQKLLRIASKLNNIFGAAIFVPMCVSSFILCLFGFLVAVTTGVPALLHFIGMIIILLGILNIVWPGQLLIDMSTGVADAAYRSLWYESDVKIRKYILIIIIRSQTPCYLSALGYANMTHSVMFKILNTTWSYITVINQMYQTN